MDKIVNNSNKAIKETDKIFEISEDYTYFIPDTLTNYEQYRTNQTPLVIDIFFFIFFYFFFFLKKINIKNLFLVNYYLYLFYYKIYLSIIYYYLFEFLILNNKNLNYYLFKIKKRYKSNKCRMGK